MRVIGTAGHVDHGKSTLVQALTGTHPDRLKEEQEREMTIDLGFAWLPLPEPSALPDAAEIGIVDVPGHRDFIENMLAGVGGVDAALFIVAADEGVMPQTREHLAILDLLQIEGGVIALTKIDLVDEPGWLDLVEEDVRRVVAGTVLANAPVVRVSGKSGQGKGDLIEALIQVLAERQPRPDLGRPRLPVDRVFTVAGFGTVVTGTLIDGTVEVGDQVEVLPRGLPGRIRGLQTHNRKVERVGPGSRAAMNITGIDVDQIQRGDVVARPGTYRPTRRLDIRFRSLPDANLTLKHNVEAKLFVGAAEVVARVRVLGQEELAPGQEGWLQLETRSPVVVAGGDRFILRRPSPGATIGGGEVIDPYPKSRHRRFSKTVLDRLNALARGTPEEIMTEAALQMGPGPVRQLIQQSNLERKTGLKTLQVLLEEKKLLWLEPGVVDLEGDAFIIAASRWQSLSGEISRIVEEYHHRHPLRAGMPKEELRSRLKLEARLFLLAMQRLAADEHLVEAGPLVSRPGHQIKFEPDQKKKVEALLAGFAANPYAPPSIKECQAAVGDEVFNALLELGTLTPVSKEVVFRQADYQALVEAVRAMLANGKSISVAQFRDRFNTTRRYALAFLEHLDNQGVTVWDGDVRKLKSS